MKKVGYYVSLSSLLMISGGLMMLMCLSIRMWFDTMDNGGADIPMFISTIAAMFFFSCMVYALFCAFRIYASHNE